MRPVVFDASVYIPFLRAEAYADLVRAATQRRTVRVCSVVLTELYAGTRSPRDKADLDAMLRAYERVGFVITPLVGDWVLAGLASRRASAIAGATQIRAHVNDLLILTSAARVGAEVVTENGRHFQRWAAVLRRMGATPHVRVVARSDHLD